MEYLNFTKEQAEERILELFDKGEIPQIVSTLNQELNITNYESRKALKKLISERDRMDTIELLNICEEEVKHNKISKWLNTEVHIIRM